MRWAILGLAGLLVCSALTVSPVAQSPAPEDELPAGEGRKILLASCTSCHDLREVTKFRGYYTRVQWRDIVVTMTEYGAPVEPRQIEVLADYLAEHFGRK